MASTDPIATSGTRAFRDALDGRMPPRYDLPPWDVFDTRVEPLLVPGVRVLDVGSGRAPNIPPERRPDGCVYVGVDISASELAAAPPGSYDESVVADAGRPVDELRDRFDLALSWQVLEHVRDVPAAIENVRTYLHPGGRFVALFSGTFSAFGLLNRALPNAASTWLLDKLLGRDRESVFPAYYDHCWYNAIERSLTGWSSAEVIPAYVGADYFRFSKPVQATYLVYEDWIARHDWKNLAGYYLIDATR